MVLNSLALQNFRNHRQLQLELPEPSIPFYIAGPNGAGKTSVIEAIHILITTKTFRRLPVSDIRTFNESFLRIEGGFSGDERIDSAVYFYEDKKVLLINGAQDLIGVPEYIRSLPVICYSPAYETLLSGEHSERRQYLDRIIFYLDKGHLETVKKYNSLLLRKRLELEKNHIDQYLIDIINEQMFPLSELISARRIKLVEEINTSIKSMPEQADFLMPGMELSLSVNSIKDKDLSIETLRGKPLYGCHKDLLYVRKSGKVMEKFQSFGQKKACLLLLLYHLAIRVEQSRKSDIILLLDDFEAGLDPKRCGMLNELISAPPVRDNQPSMHRQIILTGITNHYSGNAYTVTLKDH